MAEKKQRRCFGLTRSERASVERELGKRGLRRAASRANQIIFGFYLGFRGVASETCEDFAQEVASLK